MVVTWQQVRSLGGRVSPFAAMLAVVGAPEPTASMVAYMAWLPEALPFLFRRTEPSPCLVLILGESPCQILNLDQLAQKRGGGIAIALLEEKGSAAQ